MNGPEPLALADMIAWTKITGHIVRREEWEILRSMDDALRSAYAESTPREGT